MSHNNHLDNWLSNQHGFLLRHSPYDVSDLDEDMIERFVKLRIENHETHILGGFRYWCTKKRWYDALSEAEKRGAQWYLDSVIINNSYYGTVELERHYERTLQGYCNDIIYTIRNLLKLEALISRGIGRYAAGAKVRTTAVIRRWIRDTRRTEDVIGIFGRSNLDTVDQLSYHFDIPKIWLRNEVRKMHGLGIIWDDPEDYPGGSPQIHPTSSYAGFKRRR